MIMLLLIYSCFFFSSSPSRFHQLLFLTRNEIMASESEKNPPEKKWTECFPIEIDELRTFGIIIWWLLWQDINDRQKQNNNNNDNNGWMNHGIFFLFAPQLKWRNFEYNDHNWWIHSYGLYIKCNWTSLPKDYNNTRYTIVIDGQMWTDETNQSFCTFLFWTDLFFFLPWCRWWS